MVREIFGSIAGAREVADAAGMLVKRLRSVEGREAVACLGGGSPMRAFGGCDTLA